MSKHSISAIVSLYGFLVLLVPSLVFGGDRPAMVDIHIHYNWDQQELIDAVDVVSRLKHGNVEYAIVSGTPSHLALTLKEAGGQMIIPFFSPYTHELGKQDWFMDAMTVAQARVMQVS